MNIWKLPQKAQLITPDRSKYEKAESNWEFTAEINIKGSKNAQGGSSYDRSGPVVHVFFLFVDESGEKEGKIEK